VAKIYLGKRRNEVPPHLWAVAETAYRYAKQLIGFLYELNRYICGLDISTEKLRLQIFF
jgi:hypothetical protein